MNRDTLRKIHGISAMIAFTFIAGFWLSSIFTELFGSVKIVSFS